MIKTASIFNWVYIYIIRLSLIFLAFSLFRMGYLYSDKS